MKRMIISLALSISALMTYAMPYGEARQHALFLTDKMAYELNLTERQYNDTYQINLDYFMSVNTPADIYGPHYHCRNRDLHYILMDWQYALYTAADYFMQPLLWRANAWFLPILHRYDHAHFYFSRPRAYDVYRGGGHFNYVTRRPPHWHGGMMEHKPHHPGHDRPQPHHPNAKPGYNHQQPNTRPDNHQPQHQQPNARPVNNRPQVQPARTQRPTRSSQATTPRSQRGGR